MKAFQFRLEPVLRFRLMQREIERGKLQQLLAEQRRLREEIAKLGHERLSARRFVQKLEDANPSDYRALSSFMLGSTIRLTSLQEQLARKAALVREQMAKLQAAERNVKIVEKCKEKELYEWRSAIDKEVEAVAYEAWIAVHASGGNKTPPA